MVVQVRDGLEIRGRGTVALDHVARDVVAGVAFIADLAKVHHAAVATELLDQFLLRLVVGRPVLATEIDISGRNGLVRDWADRQWRSLDLHPHLADHDPLDDSANHHGTRPVADGDVDGVVRNCTRRGHGRKGANSQGGCGTAQSIVQSHGLLLLS